MSFDYEVKRHESLPILIAKIGRTWGEHNMAMMFAECLDACRDDEQHVIRITDFSEADMSFSDVIMLVQLLSKQQVPGSFFDTRFDDVLVGTDAWVYVARDRISKFLGQHVALFQTQEAALRYAMRQLAHGQHTEGPAAV
ncbi:MAG: hypothetical protein CL607_27290 [Anaerolineaceae bacterium]|nr:hypothetical protein [Anaerolineaceae bacterium]